MENHPLPKKLTKENIRLLFEEQKKEPAIFEDHRGEKWNRNYIYSLEETVATLTTTRNDIKETLRECWKEVNPMLQMKIEELLKG